MNNPGPARASQNVNLPFNSVPDFGKTFRNSPLYHQNGNVYPNVNNNVNSVNSNVNNNVNMNVYNNNTQSSNGNMSNNSIGRRSSQPGFSSSSSHNNFLPNPLRPSQLSRFFFFFFSSSFLFELQKLKKKFFFFLHQLGVQVIVLFQMHHILQLELSEAPYLKNSETIKQKNMKSKILLDILSNLVEINMDLVSFNKNLRLQLMKKRT